LKTISISGYRDRPSRDFSGDRQQISSLTVARQRGIFTRFPVLITVMWTREPKEVAKELEQRWKI
jgi:hypothetical protein